jgi:hypothetical protein
MRLRNGQAVEPTGELAQGLSAPHSSHDEVQPNLTRRQRVVAEPQHDLVKATAKGVDDFGDTSLTVRVQTEQPGAPDEHNVRSEGEGFHYATAASNAAAFMIAARKALGISA